MTDRLKGSVFIVLAATSYGLYGVYSRLIGGSFGEFAQSWTRNIIIITLLGVYLLIKRTWKQVAIKDRKWMIFWPLSDVVSLVLLYIAFNHLPIGTSYFLLYSTMIISGFVFGNVFYKEKVNAVKIISVAFCFAGLALIFSVEVTVNRLLYIVFGLLAGVSTGLWNTLSKKVSDKYPNLQLVFIDATVALCATLIGSLVVHDQIPVITDAVWIWQVIYAIIQISAVGFVILGFRYLEAQIASIILPVEVVFGTFFGFIFFHEVLSIKTLLGGALIATAAVLPNLQFVNKPKKKDD